MIAIYTLKIGDLIFTLNVSSIIVERITYVTAIIKKEKIKIKI